MECVGFCRRTVVVMVQSFNVGSRADWVACRQVHRYVETVEVQDRTKQCACCRGAARWSGEWALDRMHDRQIWLSRGLGDGQTEVKQQRHAGPLSLALVWMARAGSLVHSLAGRCLMG